MNFLIFFFFFFETAINAERASMHSKISVEREQKKRRLLLEGIYSKLNNLKISFQNLPITKESNETVEMIEMIEVTENNNQEEVCEKIDVEPIKGKIHPLKSEWKRIEMLGTRKTIKRSQLCFHNNKPGSQVCKLEKGEISLILNGKNVLKFNSGFFREITVPGHKVVFVCSAQKSDITM